MLELARGARSVGTLSIPVRSIALLDSTATSPQELNEGISTVTGVDKFVSDRTLSAKLFERRRYRRPHINIDLAFGEALERVLQEA